MIFRAGQRVKWKHNEPNTSEDELNGVVIALRDDRVIVRFDNGFEEDCGEEDLVIVE